MKMDVKRVAVHGMWDYKDHTAARWLWWDARSIIGGRVIVDGPSNTTWANGLAKLRTHEIQ